DLNMAAWFAARVPRQFAGKVRDVALLEWPLGTLARPDVASRRKPLRAILRRVEKHFLRRAWSLVKRVSDEADKDDADIVAAGLAFYGLLGLFPALIAMVSVYGLVADPVAIQNTLYSVARSLPGTARDVVIGELAKFIQRDSRSLSLGMVLGLLAVLWSASSAMSVLVRSINVAYDLPERHGYLKRRGVAVLFTLAAMIGLFLLIPMVALLPKILGLFHVASTLAVLRWPAIVGVAWLTFGLLYRYAAQRSPLPSLRAVLPGATFAALLWVGLCAVYSAYVEYFTSFSATYGALTGVIVLEFWLYLSSMIVVYGAELNAELMRHPWSNEQQELPLADGAVRPE
ncbi:MAG: YihY/virulence factor BrkB family protein, partial [Polyangiaceae bacterium]